MTIGIADIWYSEMGSGTAGTGYSSKSQNGRA